MERWLSAQSVAAVGAILVLLTVGVCTLHEAFRVVLMPKGALLLLRAALIAGLGLVVLGAAMYLWMRLLMWLL